MNGHRLAVRKLDLSSILKKHHLNTGHHIYFENTKNIAPLYIPKFRNIREAIETEKRPDCLHKRDDSLRLPTAYTSLISPITVNAHESTSNDKICLGSRKIEDLETI